METTHATAKTQSDQARARSAPGPAGPAPEEAAAPASPRCSPAAAVSRFQAAGPAQRARLMRQIQRAGGNGQAARLVAQARAAATPAPAPVADNATAADAPVARQAAPVQRGFLDSLSPARALLRKVAGWAMNLPGYGLLRLVLGRDPISGDAVERTPKNVLRGVMGLVPVVGEQLFRAMDEAGAIDKAFDWADGQLKQLGLSFDLIKSTFKQAWDALSIASALADPGGTWDRLKAIFLGPITKIRSFVGAAMEKVKEFIFEAVMAQMGGGPVMGMLTRAGSAISTIIKDPIGFMGNLINGVGQGFRLFGANILGHLQKGLFGWLFGEIGSAGVKLPQRFDLSGILDLVMQVLGLSWEFLRGQAVKVLGEPVVSMAEKGFKAFVLIREKGLGGLWEEIKEQLAGLKDMVFDAVKDLVTSQVIQAGIQWLLSMLGGPAGALVKAVKAIYDVVIWFVNNAQRLAALIGAVGDSIGAIAAGNLGQAAAFVERALGSSIPVLIGFLANLLGLGGLSQKIRGAIEKLQAPVKKATGFVLGKLKTWAKGAMKAIKGGLGKAGAALKQKLGIKQKPPEQRLKEGMALGVSAVNKLKGKPLVGEKLLRPLLGGIRKLKGLSVLEPVAQDGYWAVKGEVQRVVNPWKTEVKKGGDGVVDLESLRGWRPEFSASTQTELAQIYPEHHEDGTDKLLSIQLTSKKGEKYQRSLNDRRHITSFDDIKSRTLKELHGVPFRDAIITLRNKGFSPKKEDNESIVEATKKYLTRVFNDIANLYVGDSDDNQARGRTMSQFKRELEQSLESGDTNKARIAYEKYRAAAFDPEPIEYFFDKYKSFRK